MSERLKLDLNRLSGRKKICAVFPRHARLIVTLMSDEIIRKESEINDNLRLILGTDTLDRGRITHFCRCVKDTQGRFMFEVSGNRPRNIQFVLWNKR